MVDINPYYLEDSTLSNLDRIFNSADIPFVRLSKFLDLKSIIITSKFEREEKIGHYNRQTASAVLDDFWQSSEFLDFLHKATGLNPQYRDSSHLCYSGGDYSLLHQEEFEAKRLVLIYDMTKDWRLEWGGYDIYTSSEKDPLICNRDFGSLMVVKLEKGDYSCTSYVSLKANSTVNIDRVVYDLD